MPDQDFETIQFMHFGIPSFWDPPRNSSTCEPNLPRPPHDLTDHGPQTAGYYPCLNPDVFNPTNLDPEDWMAASKAMGMKEIHHGAPRGGRPVAIEAH